MNILALVFDFDDTLVPDSTTQLLNHYGIDTKKFWGDDFVVLVKQGYSPVNAYLRLILKEIKNGKLKGLKNEDLRNFGAYLPEYGKGKSLGEVIRTTVEVKCGEIYLKETAQ